MLLLHPGGVLALGDLTPHLVVEGIRRLDPHYPTVVGDYREDLM
jgi:hypothetical protein